MIRIVLLLMFTVSMSAQTYGGFNSPNGSGLPVYPGATPMQHGDEDRGAVATDSNQQLQSVAGNAYVTADTPDKVLQFYRNRMRSMGQVVECNGGQNQIADVQVDDSFFVETNSCRPTTFGEGGTELKIVRDGEQQIVVVLPHGTGSEIALVRVKK